MLFLEVSWSLTVTYEDGLAACWQSEGPEEVWAVQSGVRARARLQRIATPHTHTVWAKCLDRFLFLRKICNFFLIEKHFSSNWRRITKEIFSLRYWSFDQCCCCCHKITEKINFCRKIKSSRSNWCRIRCCVEYYRTSVDICKVRPFRIPGKFEEEGFVNFTYVVAKKRPDRSPRFEVRGLIRCRCFLVSCFFSVGIRFLVGGRTNCCCVVKRTNLKFK